MADFIPRISYGSGPTVVAFTYAPDGDPVNEVAKTYTTSTTSASGVIQANQKYIESIRTLKVSFVSSTIKTNFQTFFETWGSLKKTFTFYPHTDVDTGSLTCTLVDDKIEYDRDLPDGSGDFLYTWKFSVRSLA